MHVQRIPPASCAVWEVNYLVTRSDYALWSVECVSFRHDWQDRQERRGLSRALSVPVRLVRLGDRCTSHSIAGRTNIWPSSTDAGTAVQQYSSVNTQSVLLAPDPSATRIHINLTVSLILFDQGDPGRFFGTSNTIGSSLHWQMVRATVVEGSCSLTLSIKSIY